ncbi:MAG: phosphoribosylformylglycinamidine cyclo-ligase [FCB group bacterium]|nr:phosphoribosylformylglycinamidine cyclo-ligase [FCB group bacterium]
MKYKDAGVDIEAGKRSVSRIKHYVKSTFTGAVLTDLGSFGGCYQFPADEYAEPVLVSSADGVGTKLKIAFLTGIHHTIGQCLVNHCVNDILAIGARPLYFLDYFAADSLDENVFEEVIKGLSRACRENGCALIGGETAEMPGFYNPREYDISGTITGVVDKQFLLTKRDTKPGDLLVGLPSTGLHTNGYSLAREVLLEKYRVEEYFPELGSTLGDSLLSIHRSYLPAVGGILEKPWLRSISHITGGGIVDNTNRVIEKSQALEIKWEAWEWPPIFKLIQKIGRVATEEMRRCMNLGIGLILIVNPEGLEELESYFQGLRQEFIILGCVK